MSERAETMRRFLDEYRFATGRDGSDPFMKADLPDPSQFRVRDIHLPIESVVRFRNNYRFVIEFAALVCGCKVEELTPFHLIALFLRRDDE